MKNFFLLLPKLRIIMIFLFCISIQLFPQQRAGNDYIRCATTEYMQYLISQNPKLGDRLNMMEDQLQSYLAFTETRSTETVISIPVVVHIIYRTAAENISTATVTSQIRVLNEDFRKMLGTPGWNNDSVGADTKIEFYLAERDPNGNPHSGINRVQTTQTSFSYPGDNSFLKSLSYWPSDKYLNIWTCNLGGGLLGYAQFPGGPAATDGVVILYSAFGYNSPAIPYNLGRTATHEIGHWFNLYHIWGDVSDCSGTDLIDDTPPCSDEYSSGYPSCPNPFQCGYTRMIENYMDYSDDGCMNIYTNGQRDRMKAAYTLFRPNLLVGIKEKIAVTATGTDYTFTDLNGQPFANLNFASLGSIDSVTVEVFPNLLPPSMSAGTKAVKRYFNITADGTGFIATLTVYYKDDEVTGFVNGDSNLNLYKYDGSEWLYMGGSVNSSANSVTLANVSDFSTWALSDPADDPIPVELTSFSSVVEGNNVTLNWITATEVNSRGFEIEKSVLKDQDSKQWEEIGFVQSQGTSTSISGYSFTDSKLQPGNYNYRLKLVDNDGTFEYSNVIFINVPVPSVYYLSQNFPNPFNPTTIISYKLPEKGHVSLKIFDAIGNEVIALVNEEEEAGDYDASFDASKLSSGVYFYTLISNNFMQTNKMILMK